MPMYNLIEYSDNYLKISGNLWQYCRDNLAVNNNFWRTLEMSLITCEINLILTWSANCVIVSTAVANQGSTFTITYTKCYVPVGTLSARTI